MKKSLVSVIVAVVCILAGFILSVVITEKQNNSFIRQKYIYSQPAVRSGEVAMPPTSDKALEFQKTKVAVWLINLILSLVIPAAFLFSGLAAGIRSWARMKTGNMFLMMALYYIVFSLINYILTLPVDYYSSFARLHAYGLSNQTFAKWIGDSLKSLAIDIVVGAALIWIPYGIIKASPTRWWLYTGLISVPILLFTMFISPVLIDPIFNKYGPVQNKTLETEIRQELNRTTIGGCSVFQVNKSVDTNQMNAYMTGVWNTKRIVLWDTTIKQLTEKEVLGVVAHEMGHYLMGHVWKSTVLGGFLSILLFFLADRSAIWILARSGSTFGFNKLYDIASLPLLILLLNLFMFIAAPAENAYSRSIEHEADRFELELTKDNRAAAASTVKLHQESLTLPQPGIIYTLWNYDHPTFESRVEFANTYKPWEEGKPLVYQKYIVK